jgi:Peptidase family M49
MQSPTMDIKERLKLYIPVRLQPQLDHLTPNERQLLPLFKEAADAMDLPYWIQEFGDPSELFSRAPGEELRKYLRINYGPWDRNFYHEPFLTGFGQKPKGANYYPADITRQEFESGVRENPGLKSPYTMVRRDRDGNLVAIPYHEFFAEHVDRASAILKQASDLSDSVELKKFLTLRAGALQTDDYRPSDMAWMEMQQPNIDLLIGPTEVEDRLFGIKTAFSGAIFIKNIAASRQLSTYRDLIPQFQASLPVPEPYKRERPGLDSDVRVYDLFHVAGLDRCNSPSGVAWPNDEEVQLEKGVRSLLIQNMIQAKYEHLFPPLADLLLDREQAAQVRFDARLMFVLLHEIAHGLGDKFTLNEQKPVLEMMGDLSHPIEEAKADLVGLWLATRLNAWGRMSEEELNALYVTSLVSLFYNFDARQSILRLNYFMQRGAYSRDVGTGTYRVHSEHMPAAIESLSNRLLSLQGDGDYRGAQDLLADYALPNPELRLDLERIQAARLPLGILIED